MYSQFCHPPSLRARTPSGRSSRSQFCRSRSWTGFSPGWSFHQLPLSRRDTHWCLGDKPSAENVVLCGSLGSKLLQRITTRGPRFRAKFSVVSGQPSSVEAIRAVSDQRTRYAITCGVRGERPRCGSECQGILRLPLEPRPRQALHGAEATRTRREKSGCPVRPRKELPVLNLWRRSRKAINRELHAF